MSKRNICVLIALLPLWAAGQEDGGMAYSFLTLPSSAKQAAIGGVPVLPLHNDVSQIAHAPSLLDSTFHKQAAVGYANYFANAHSVSAAGAWGGGKWGSWAAAVRGVNYGSFEGYNEFGDHEGSFSANEMAVTAHWAHGVGRFLSVGAAVKVLLSQLETYVSAGVAIDVSCRYRSADGLTNVIFSVKNAGVQVKPYYSGGVRQRVPLEVQAAAAHKFEAAPFGISLSLNNLQRWDLYRTPPAVSVLQETESESAFTRWGREVMCHISGGVGVYPSKRFFIMAGYNYLRARELRANQQWSGSGFSVGAGLRLKYVELSYAWGIYHSAGGSHSIGAAVEIGGYK